MKKQAKRQRAATMRKQAKRQRAATKAILNAQRKAAEGKPKTALEEFIASIPDEGQRENYRDGVKRGREALYRVRSAGHELTDDLHAFASIKYAVDQPEIDLVNLYYEGKVPGDLPKAPWILCIKTPRVPDISKATGCTVPCGSWPQFIAAVVAYGDKEARDDIRWVLEEAQGITPMEDEELENSRKMVGRELDQFIKERGADRSKVINADQAFGNWVKFRLFPESEPDKVRQIANAHGKSFNEMVQEIKSGRMGFEEEEEKWKPGMPITKTKTIRGHSSSFNECVMPLLTSMFDREGKLHRHEDGQVLSFDEIWTDILQMDEEVPEGESTGHDIIVCRLREIAEMEPDKTPEELKAGFRKRL
jgi:hypothetical protein